MSMCDAGRKESTPMLTIRPPLTLARTRPEAMEPSGKPGENVVPVLLLFGLVERNDGIPVLVLELLEENVDGGTDLQFAEIDELTRRDHSLGLGADVDDHVVLADFGDNTRDNSALFQKTEGGLSQKLFHYRTHVQERWFTAGSNAAPHRDGPRRAVG
jgi:hypothetical protein